MKNDTGHFLRTTNPKHREKKILPLIKISSKNLTAFGVWGGKRLNLPKTRAAKEKVEIEFVFVYLPSSFSDNLRMPSATNQSDSVGRQMRQIFVRPLDCRSTNLPSDLFACPNLQRTKNLRSWFEKQDRLPCKHIPGENDFRNQKRPTDLQKGGSVWLHDTSAQSVR